LAIPDLIEEGKPSSLSCKHHWVISANTGPRSLGSCRLCGIKKEFLNSMEISPWGEDKEISSAPNEIKISVPNDEPYNPDDE
jgi:hypothetical protein